MSSDYIAIGFVVPTSSFMEKFFSTADYDLADNRKSISPMNLEMQLGTTNMTLSFLTLTLL